MTMQRHALITGVLGFCGRHLAAHLQASGYRISGLDQARGEAPGGVTMHLGDIRDQACLADLLRKVEPSDIFHLAALTNPQAGWDALSDVNVRGTGQLLEAARLCDPSPTIVVAGSSAAYGAVVPGELPIGEDQPFRPRSAYAVSKVAQEMLAYSYYARFGLRVVRARPFNLTGPGESPAFVTSAFAQQIARIEAGLQPPVVEVGNLGSVRDFTDVRDVVQAYRLLGEHGRPGEVYNICSGKGIEIRLLLDTLISLSHVPGIAVNYSESRWQVADVPSQVGDAGRLVRDTGWQPEIPLYQTLEDLLNSWRRQMPPRSIL